MSALVTVIIPVYNVFPYLRESLDSVINQTYKNLEIIIVDDGSTDGSQYICDEYKSDARVVVIHQENRGLSEARNTGLNAMTGKYVAFLDADDAFLPEFIQTMVSYLNKNTIDIIACGFYDVWDEHCLTAAKINKNDVYSFINIEIIDAKEAQRRVIYGKLNISVWNKLYCSRIWDNIRFPGDRVYEDMWVVFRVLEKCNGIMVLPEIHIIHRKRKGSITSNASCKSEYDRVLANECMEDYVIANTPSIFTLEDLHTIRENVTVAMSVCYANIHYRFKNREISESIKDEVFNRWNDLSPNFSNAKIKSTYFLFRYAPCLILPIRRIWRGGKWMLKRR